MKKYLAIIASILLISINIEVCNAADTGPGIVTAVCLTDNKTSNLINDYNSAMDVLSFNDEKIISYRSQSNSISAGKTFVLDTRYNTNKSKYYIGITAQVNQL